MIIIDDRYEIVAKKKHFITINFQEFSLQDQNQCGTGFLELRSLLILSFIFILL